MQQLYDLQDIIRETGLPERTVRYYLAKILEAPTGKPGRKSYYRRITVDQLLLARQILMRDYDPRRGEIKPSLREFRQWIETLSEDEIRKLVEMPCRIKPKSQLMTQVSEPSPRGSVHNRDSIGEDSPARTESKQGDLKRIRGTGRGRQRHAQPWHTHRFGEELQIRTRKPLTGEHRRQVCLSGQLLRSILDL